MNKSFAGACQCGNIAFHVTGDPVMVANCFCLDCRKTSGAAGATVAVFSHDGFAVDRGQAIRYTSKAASGRSLTRNFCPACGSRLFTSDIETFPGMVIVALGALNDGHGLAPGINIFDKDRPVWSFGTDTLPAVDAMPT